MGKSGLGALGSVWPSTVPSAPRVIQGGMGIGVSGWRLARAVSSAGGLGVVSGTALDVMCARRLQCGDPGGHVRRAISHFPIPDMAQRVLHSYYVPGGKAPEQPFRPVPCYTFHPGRALTDLTIVSNFVEIFLAKEGHGGPVGINYLRKIELPIPFACYGAMLAGVDYVIAGAGDPSEMPLLVSRLAAHQRGSLSVRVLGLASSEGPFLSECDPSSLWSGPVAPLRRPKVLAIVASRDLAARLAEDPATRPDGFVVEGHIAGGHNAPPRGPRRLDATGQPIYDELDVVDPHEMPSIGLPFWMAGGLGTPEALARVIEAGAVGVQVGTLFALSEESDMMDSCKRGVRRHAWYGRAAVRTDPLASPTGFPFKIVQIDGSVSEPDVYEQRTRVCDLALLRSPYRKADGTIGFRCPAEPVNSYQAHGGRVGNITGRVCVCNGLLGTVGLGQVRPDRRVEPPLVTSGSDLSVVRRFLETQGGPDRVYAARDVLAYLLGASASVADEVPFGLGSSAPAESPRWSEEQPYDQA